VTSAPLPRVAPTNRGVAVSGIAGLGVYRPSPTAPLAARVTGADCTGVSSRVQAAQGVNTASLAAGAARAALQVSGVAKQDVGMIIVGTTSPDVLWPATACLIQTELALPMVASFDLYAAETSLLAALNVGTRYVGSGAGAVLLVGAESDNQLVDLPGHRGAIQGRAASAIVLTRGGGESGVLSTMAGGGARPDMNGEGQDRALLQGLSDGVQACLREARLGLQDIDLVIGEQSAPDLSRAWAKAHGVSQDRLLLNPTRYGSLGAAAPLAALYDAVLEGRLKTGMTAILLACGGGPSWAVSCLRWGGGGLAEW
jgi:3-oxoacyl-[acyl-carrier-protein] synthase III